MLTDAATNCKPELMYTVPNEIEVVAPDDADENIMYANTCKVIKPKINE